MPSHHHEAARIATNSRALTIVNLGGDVFRANAEASYRSVLWGELFKESERRFFRKEVEELTATFSVRDNFQIVTRCAWQPEARALAPGCMREGRFAVLLHAMNNPRGSAWTWAKLARPLFQEGLSVVMMEFPGFGNSTMNMDKEVKVSAWAHMDYQIVLRVAAEVQVDKFHLVLDGDSARVLFRLLENAPHRLEKEHLLHNPSPDFADLFPPDDARLVVVDTTEARVREFAKQLRKSGLRLYCSFGEDAPTLARELRDLLREMRTRSQVMAMNLRVDDITREDLCEAQIGALVDIRFYFMGRTLKQRYVQWMDPASHAMLWAGFGQTEGEAHSHGGTGGSRPHGDSMRESHSLGRMRESLSDPRISIVAEPAPAPPPPHELRQQQFKRSPSAAGNAPSSWLATPGGGEAGGQMLALAGPQPPQRQPPRLLQERRGSGVAPDPASSQHQQAANEMVRPGSSPTLTTLKRATTNASMMMSMAEARWALTKIMHPDPRLARLKTLEKMPADMRPPSVDAIRSVEPVLASADRKSLFGVAVDPETGEGGAFGRSRGDDEQSNVSSPSKNRSMWKSVNSLGRKPKMAFA